MDKIPLKKIAAIAPYMVNSVCATAADFSTFHLLITRAATEPVLATFVANIVGAVVSFFLLRFWVFADAAPARLRVQMVKFAVGVFLIMATNAVLVAFFHHICGLLPWPARIGAAAGAWFVGYYFNRKIVFEKAEAE